MSKWRKAFEKWRRATQPEAYDTVEAIVYRVFGDRVRRAEGTSHALHISVPELVETGKDFSLGEIRIVVKENKVKADYLRNAYAAAALLGLDGVERDDNVQ